MPTIYRVRFFDGEGFNEKLLMAENEADITGYMASKGFSEIIVENLGPDYPCN